MTRDELPLERMTDMAMSVYENSYAPYSKYRVGACVCCEDGTLYAGTNVENMSFSLTMCAERNAIFNAVGDGQSELFAILIYSDCEDLPYPCGACLQVMAEFNKDMLVIVTNGEDIEEYTVGKLLPKSFSF